MLVEVFPELIEITPNHDGTQEALVTEHRGRALLLFLMRAIGTPRFGLVEFVNAFVNETKVGIDFVDFG